MSKRYFIHILKNQHFLGYFCKSGQMIKCPIGFICPEEGLSMPKKCKTTKNSTCHWVGLTDNQPCPKGALCITPHSLPIKAPPGYYLYKNERLEKCDLGDYCPFGMYLDEPTKTDQLLCPAFTACKNSSVLYPQPW